MTVAASVQPAVGVVGPIQASQPIMLLPSRIIMGIGITTGRRWVKVKVKVEAEGVLHRRRPPPVAAAVAVAVARHDPLYFVLYTVTLLSLLLCFRSSLSILFYTVALLLSLLRLLFAFE